MQHPEERRDYWGMSGCVAGILAGMVFVYFRTRIDWHYELDLTPAELRVSYISSGQRWLTTRIDLTPIRQFTVVTHGVKTSLQAESVEDPPRLILRNGEAGLLLRVAQRLAEERAALDPQLPVLRVTVEPPAAEAGADRFEQPLHSKIALTRQEAGLTLDFPLPESARTATLRNAWITFEIGILLWMGALIWFSRFAGCRDGMTCKAGPSQPFSADSWR